MLRASRITEAKTWRPFIAVMIMIGFGCAVILLVCGFFVWKGATETVRQDRLLARAVAVEAEVIESHIGESSHRAGSGRRGGGTRHSTYWPRVRYAYSVAGERFESDGIWAVGHGGGEQWAVDIVSRYPAGARVTAHYDPAAPANAILEKRHAIGPYASVGVGASSAGIIFTIIAVMLMVWPRASGAAAAAGLAVWVGPAAGAAWHYFAHVPGPHGWAAAAITGGYFGLGLAIPGYVGARMLWWPGKMTRAVRAGVKKSRRPA